MPNAAGAYNDFAFNGNFKVVKSTSDWSATYFTQKVSDNHYTGTLDASGMTNGGTYYFKFYNEENNGSTQTWWGDGSTWDFTTNQTISKSINYNGDNMSFVHNSAYSSYTVDAQWTGEKWTVSVTGVASASTTTYSIVGTNLAANTTGSFTGYTPTASTPVTFKIGNTTYGLSSATTIDAAGTTDYTLVANSANALTLSPDLTYSFTITSDGKVTVVASSKTTPVTPTTGSDEIAYYLVTNFFAGTGGDTSYGDNINYTRRIFKFTQKEGDATTYTLDIPATVSGNAQILAVNGTTETLWGPASAGYGIHAANSSEAGWPATNGSVSGDAMSSSTDKALGNMYWTFTSRNNNDDKGDDDGMYTISFTLSNGNPSKWTIKHDINHQLSYVLSTAEGATAQPLYGVRNITDASNSSNWGTKFDDRIFSYVHLSRNENYYIIGNIEVSKDAIDNGWNVNASEYGAHINRHSSSGDVRPTTSKLFLMGNGNNTFNSSTSSDNFGKLNEVSPESGYIHFDVDDGVYYLQYNPTNGEQSVFQSGNTLNNISKGKYGIRGQIIMLNGGKPQFSSVAILGSAIPGTFDGTATEADGDLTKWHWASPLAMTYNESTRAYEVTIETTRNQGSTADSPAGWFRFEADPTTSSTLDNVKTWCDDATLANVPYPTATGGSNATEADPNQVILSTEYSASENNIKFNREPGKYTIRFYAEKRLNGTSYDDYYAYTITADPNSIKIAPRDEIVEFGQQVAPTVTVTTGDAETSTRYFVFTYDGTDPKDVPLSDENINIISYDPSKASSAPIGTFGIDPNHIFAYTFESNSVDLSSKLSNPKDEDGYYTVTIRVMALKKNGDTYVQLPNVTDEVTYKFAPETYSLNINAGAYTKDLNDVPENYNNSFLGINTVDLHVTVGKGTEVKEPTPEPEPTTAKKKVNRPMRRAKNETRGDTDNNDPLYGQNVYYHVWDGKQWGPTMNVFAYDDGIAHISLHTLSSEPGSADNKVEVWIDGQVKSNTYAKQLLKYDITYSTSDGSYKDAINQSFGSSSDEFNIYVLDADASNKEIYARVVSNTQDASTESPKTIFVSPDNGTLLTSKKTIGVKEWYVFTVTDLWYYFGDQDGSFSVQFADAANRDKIASATTFDNLIGDVFFEYKDGTFTQDDNAPEGFISCGNINHFPESLGDESWKIPVTGAPDAGLLWSKTSQNPYLSYIKATSGSPVSFTVPAASLVGGSKYTVQAIVRAADSGSDTESSSTATLDLKAGDATATSGTISVSNTTGGNVSKDGRVDVFATSSDTGYGWKKLEATVTEPATAQDLTMTFTAGSGADIYITNLILLKDANTPGHFWTKAPTSEGTTSYDLSSRTTANAFSFFDRGDNKNAIVFANDKTVIGGFKDGMKIPNVDLQYNEQGDVSFSGTKSPYNVAVKGTDGYTIETLKLTDNGSESVNPHAFGFDSKKSVTAKKVEYDRNFKQGYQTVCLPFALSSSQLSTLNATAYSLTGFTINKNSHKATMTFEPVSATVAGQPYIFECNAPVEGISLNAESTLAGGATTQPKTGEKADIFTGVFSQTNIDLNPKDKKEVPSYWGFSNGIFMPARFAWENKPNTIMKPFRGYFTIGETTKSALAKMAPSSMKNLRMYFAIGEGTTTGIGEVSVETETVNNAPIFNLSGQMVSKDGNRKNLQRGVYIQNNQKFVVR